MQDLAAKKKKKKKKTYVSKNSGKKYREMKHMVDGKLWEDTELWSMIYYSYM